MQEYHKYLTEHNYYTVLALGGEIWIFVDISACHLFYLHDIDLDSLDMGTLVLSCSSR